MSETESPSNDLCFDFLDDLALASARGRADPYHYLKSRRLNRIGPLLELVVLDRLDVLPIRALPECDVRDALSSALNCGGMPQGAYVTQNGASVGFIRTNRIPNAEDQVHWVSFCRKAQDAAEESLPKPVAQGLVGAMRELEENVHIHSQRTLDGMVAFRGTAEEFEFAVVDSGIGVLESLRLSPDYQHLTDSGTAIKTALTDGQSSLRYQDPGRGYGFHDLFVGLANLNGELRFRSGDHALTIDGASPSLVTSRLSQKVNLSGFSVNIVCSIIPGQTLH